MHKRSAILFGLLLAFWLVVSAALDLQHIIVGIILSLFTIWLWHDLESKLPRILSFRELLLFGRCIIMLIGYVIISNIDVIKTLLFSNPPVSPIFLEMETDIENDWVRVFLATCITITPGTITVDIDPDTNIFTVHALTRETGEALFYWRIISEIKKLETLAKRREAHAVDTGRVNIIDSIGALARDHWTNRR